MKILIVSPPRCGSTSLLNNLCELTNSKRIAEPYTNPKELLTRKQNEYPLNLNGNYIVKMVSNQVPESYREDFESFITLVYREYSKVILLSRRNLQEHFESYINLRSRLNKKDVHDSWYIDDIKPFCNRFDIEKFKLKTTVVDIISKKLKIPIIYYEDLYGKDRKKSLKIIESLNLNIDNSKLNDKLNPIFRYRQFTKRPIL
tara:strand:+ start:1993 stop:2598 length:606 start_codon:yes stop_codon:yes gene_type:complete